MNKLTISCFLVISLLSVGCNLLSKSISEPLEYKTRVFEQPYDLVYLKTLETLDQHNDWVLNRTRKDDGIIEIRNIVYANFFDIDEQFVRFIIGHVDRTHTSVGVEVDSVKCKGQDCLEMLEHVHRVIEALPKRIREETAPVSPYQV